MAFGLYSLLEAALLVLNAMCVLHEERFLAKVSQLVNKDWRDGVTQLPAAPCAADGMQSSNLLLSHLSLGGAEGKYRKIGTEISSVKILKFS